MADNDPGKAIVDPLQPLLFMTVRSAVGGISDRAWLEWGDKPQQAGNDVVETHVSVDPARRSISLRGPITDQVSFVVCNLLRELDSPTDPRIQAVAKDANWQAQPITLKLHSPGGSVSAGYEIVDAMSALNTPVKTTCTGFAASMAAVILACGDIRTAYPHGRILIHAVHTGGGGIRGNAFELQEQVEMMAGIQADIEKTLRDHSGRKLNAAKLHRMMKAGDKTMKPREALSMGLIDSIEMGHAIGKKPGLNLTAAPDAQAKRLSAPTIAVVTRNSGGEIAA